MGLINLINYLLLTVAIQSSTCNGNVKENRIMYDGFD